MFRPGILYKFYNADSNPGPLLALFGSGSRGEKREEKKFSHIFHNRHGKSRKIKDQQQNNINWMRNNGQNNTKNPYQKIHLKEIPIRKWATRSVVSIADINKGEFFSLKNDQNLNWYSRRVGL